MKIAILNVKYSPNLGDGLLSECLERELAVTGLPVDVISVDLAGRERFGELSSHRGGMLRLLESLPRPLRTLTAYVALRTMATLRLKPHYRAGLAGRDAVILGGGNLLSDTDLNFPMKIAAALEEARRSDLPVAIFAVGVSDNWSTTGARLFGNAFRRARLTDVSVRDERSRGIWRKHMPDVIEARLVLDPGLLASRHYAAASRDGTAVEIGLCITDPLALRYHGGEREIANDMAAWYGALANALAGAGWRVTLFTNGSPEDRAFLESHGESWRAANPEAIAIAPAFAQPADLVAAISRCDAVIAHRMHACIAAHSFAIPTVGLRWDPKLDAFFALVGRSGYVVSAAATQPQEVADLTRQALEEGVDAEVHAHMIESARADVSTLAGILAKATGARQ